MSDCAVHPPHSLIRRLAAWVRDNRGSAAMSFIMAFPIFLVIVAILVQTALLVNARIIVQAAAERAARSAVTCLPEEQYPNIQRAAEIALVPLSPQTGGAIDPEGATVADAFQQNGVQVADSFAGRYTYAMAATTVAYPQANYRQLPAQQVELTVTYRFRLTIPGVMMLLGNQDTVGGVSGRFFTLSAKTTFETAHGRAAAADPTGWPAGGQTQ